MDKIINTNEWGQNLLKYLKVQKQNQNTRDEEIQRKFWHDYGMATGRSLHNFTYVPPEPKNLMKGATKYTVLPSNSSSITGKLIGEKKKFKNV